MPLPKKIAVAGATGRVGDHAVDVLKARGHDVVVLHHRGPQLAPAGQRAGVRQMIVASIIGTDRFTVGYGVAKIAHEQAHLSAPIPARVLRAAQFHELVALLVDWAPRATSPNGGPPVIVATRAGCPGSTRPRCRG